MMDEDFVERRPADLEIYRRLDAFAQVRLTPDATSMARIRTALMGQALALADARSAALTIPAPLPVALPERPAIAFPRPRRRAAAVVLAACLVVGIGAGSVAASQAGGPLYGPRMWIEAATLPSDPMARANAQLGRLDARLQEVRVASASGDAGAAEAALDAYAVIMADLEAQAFANSAVAVAVEDDVARRQIVLMGLLDDVPAQALDAIQHALQQGANAIGGNDVDPHPGDPRRPDAGGQDGSQGGSGQGGGSQGQGPATGQGTGQDQGAGQGSGPNREPTPEPTPDPTPKPTKPPKAPAADPTPAQRPATPTATGGGNQNENRGSSRQTESAGGQGGPASDQGDD
jgi:hypothetical protein